MGALDCVSNKEKNTGSTEVIVVSTSSDLNLNVPRTDLESQELSKSNKEVKRHSILWHLLTDVPLFVIISVLLILFEWSILPTRKSGFYCNDPALSFPYTGDTVSKTSLMMSVTLVPLIIIALVEFLLDEAGGTFKGKMWNTIRTTLPLYRNFIFGFFMNLITVEALKFVTGFPRPVFFALCEPDTAINCTGSEYINTFRCTSTHSVWVQTDASHSFPSGHTSLSVYNGLHMAWYLQQRVFDWRGKSVLIVPFNQALCIVYVVVCSMTRITDHMHHWWDVLAGAIIGFGSFYYSVCVLNKNYSRPKSTDDKETEEIENPRRILLS